MAEMLAQAVIIIAAALNVGFQRFCRISYLSGHDNIADDVGLRQAERHTLHLGEPMNLKQRFWRFAYVRYQTRRPSHMRERLAFGISIYFGLVYAFAFWRNFEENLKVIPGVIGLALLPLGLALSHRRIRLEHAKGVNALYRKMLSIMTK